MCYLLSDTVWAIQSQDWVIPVDLFHSFFGLFTKLAGDVSFLDKGHQSIAGTPDTRKRNVLVSMRGSNPSLPYGPYLEMCYTKKSVLLLPECHRARSPGSPGLTLLFRVVWVQQSSKGTFLVGQRLRVLFLMLLLAHIIQVILTTVGIHLGFIKPVTYIIYTLCPF